MNYTESILNFIDGILFEKFIIPRPLFSINKENVDSRLWNVKKSKKLEKSVLSLL